MALGVLARIWAAHIRSVKALHTLSKATLSLVLLAAALGAVVLAAGLLAVGARSVPVVVTFNGEARPPRPPAA